MVRVDVGQLCVALCVWRLVTFKMFVWVCRTFKICTGTCIEKIALFFKGARAGFHVGFSFNFSLNSCLDVSAHSSLSERLWSSGLHLDLRSVLLTLAERSFPSITLMNCQIRGVNVLFESWSLAFTSFFFLLFGQTVILMRVDEFPSFFNSFWKFWTN